MMRWTDKLNDFLRNLVLLLLAVIAAAEIFLRILEPFTSLYRNDPVLGIRRKAFLGSANSLGFNDREYPLRKPPGTFRVIALGDSFNWVGNEHNYWALAEKRLENSGLGKKIEILNQGTSMTGPAYELRLLKTVSMDFDPDLVVLAFFVGNDFNESDGNVLRIQRFGHFVDRERNPAGRVSLSWDKDSYLWFFLNRKWKELTNAVKVFREKCKDGSRGFFAKDYFMEIQETKMQFFGPDFYRGKYWEDTRLRIREFKTFLKQRNVRFAVVIIPDVLQVDEVLQKELQTTFPGSVGETYDVELPQKKMAQFLTAENIPFLDLLPAFREEGKKHELYGYRETHFNDRGNSLAAAQAAQFLKSQISPDE